ncbi:MAG: CYTH domain-containing protein [Patescibacteria group bacterium]|nr:CYTH domain-containing protein [Patescibacteria group bacterium]MDD4304574.1 CYTH domain-containing protein [Patescibacteria group bacterium]MDD4695609.1 CYTH domain-containing protein [Patescibacteria group bacterium]
MEEIEVKFLNINTDLIIRKLEKLGAEKVFNKTYYRKVFDYPDWRLDKDNSWLRLRDEGEKITLSFKKRINPGLNGSNDEGMEEKEIEVSNFEKTADILLNIGLIEKHYIENKRIRYILDDIEFDIDFYPQLEPYLEIEAPSWEKINKAIELLELNSKDQKIFSTSQVYSQKGIDVGDYKKITFQEMILK